MIKIVLIAHNIRSTHNVGSLLRTAEGIGVREVYFTGYTPYPKRSKENRLPHIASKLDKQISKTALGAENLIKWHHESSIEVPIDLLRNNGYIIAALEQTKSSRDLSSLSPPEKIALVIGREVEGIEAEVLALCDFALEIPMFGQKESFNVVQAAAMALYHLRFYQ